VLKFWRPGPKGRKIAVKGGSFFVTGTMNLHFFVTGQIGKKFGRNVNHCPLLNLNWTILKICPNGVILHQTAIFGLLWRFSMS